MISGKYCMFLIIIGLGFMGLPVKSEAGISFSFRSGSSCGSYHYRNNYHYRAGYPRYRSYCYPRRYHYVRPYYYAPPVTVQRYYVYPETETVYSNNWYDRGNGYPAANPKYQTAEPYQEEITQSPEETQATSEPPKQTVSQSFARSIQKRLKDRGFYNGEIDGVMGDLTRDAIRALQRAGGLEETGQLDEGVLQDLGFLSSWSDTKTFL